MTSSDDEPTYAPDSKGKKRLTWFSKIFILGLIVVPIAYAIPDFETQVKKKETIGITAKTDYKTTPLINEEYYHTLLDLFDRAEKKIFVGMFVIKPRSLYRENWPAWRTDRVLKLMKKLVEARKRGVKVTVIVSKPRTDKEDEKNKANRVAINWLRERGIQAGYNQSTVKLHDKVVIIDQKWIVQGSHNWTPGPLSTNVEASLLLEAEDGDQWSWKRYHEDLSVGVKDNDA
ncbi:MAG: phospholipase D-like domain-containing protein [bacterium]